MAQSWTIVQSFDLFDTLLARHCVLPSKIFDEIERRFGASGFSRIRQQTEWALANAAVDSFSLQDVYAAMVSGGILSSTDAKTLMAAEIDLEFENAVPIRENIRQVKPGDLVISDMYLPKAVLRCLMNQIGVTPLAELIVSNSGKRSGSLWSDLKAHKLISRHLGDNPLSDHQQAIVAGIPSLLYAGHQPSTVEQSLSAIGRVELSRCCRRLRLENPYDDPDRSALWNVFVELNLPLLFMFCQRVRLERDRRQAKKILFCARDGYFLHELFTLFFPDEPAEYLYVSRAALHLADANYLAYFKQSHRETTLIVDLNGTGDSWYRFCEKHKQTASLFYLVMTNNSPFARSSFHEVIKSPCLDVGWQFLSSDRAFGAHHVEVINQAPTGSCQGVKAIGRHFVPVNSELHEFAPELVDATASAHRRTIEVLRQHREALLAEIVLPPDVDTMASLFDEIVSNPLLTTLGGKLKWPQCYGPMIR